MPRKKIYKIQDVPSAKIKYLPGYDLSCPFCRLDLEELKEVHDLYFNKNWTYPQIREYTKSVLSMAPSDTWMTNHFSKHTRQGLDKKKNKLFKDTPATQMVKKLPKGVKKRTDKKIESAFKKLTKMTIDHTNRVADIYEKIHFNIDDDEVAQQIKELGVVKGLEFLGKLHKEAREQLKDIQSLRAPKVIVADFLEKTINEVIYVTGSLLQELCVKLQIEVNKKLKKHNLEMDKETFANVFSDIGIQYKNRMLALRSEQLSKAMSTLADLEKII
jgi:hypothetical protein